jgi:serine/threonine-protein kinase RsbW
MRSLELTIGSDLGDVSLVAVAVNRVCIYLGLDPVVASQVELCTVEALTNVIQHGYQGQSGHLVSVVLSCGIDQVQLEVIDHGNPMPAESVEKLLLGTDLFQIPNAELVESGRGLQIMHDLMDMIAYVPEGSVNRLRLTKRIRVPGHAERE